MNKLVDHMARDAGMKERRFRGSCVGVKLSARSGPDDRDGMDDLHIMVSLEIEDDEVWHEKDFQISSYWLDELIAQLQAARTFCATQEADMVAKADGFATNTHLGWKFKS